MVEDICQFPFWISSGNPGGIPQAFPVNYGPIYPDRSEFEGPAMGDGRNFKIFSLQQKERSQEGRKDVLFPIWNPHG